MGNNKVKHRLTLMQAAPGWFGNDKDFFDFQREIDDVSGICSSRI